MAPKSSTYYAMVAARKAVDHEWDRIVQGRGSGRLAEKEANLAKWQEKFEAEEKANPSPPEDFEDGRDDEDY